MSRNNKRQYQWIKVDSDKCVKCQKCVNYCPRDVLRPDETGLPYMKFRDDCWYCDACTYMCPTGALQLEEVPYLIK